MNPETALPVTSNVPFSFFPAGEYGPVGGVGDLLLARLGACFAAVGDKSIGSCPDDSSSCSKSLFWPLGCFAGVPSQLNGFDRIDFNPPIRPKEDSDPERVRPPPPVDLVAEEEVKLRILWGPEAALRLSELLPLRVYEGEPLSPLPLGARPDGPGRA